jgi:hypothetical protein
VNADLFFLLALQQTCKGENSELALSSLLSCVVPLHTNLCLTQALNPPGGLGAKENLLNSQIAGIDISAAHSPCCLLPPLWIR